MNNNNIAEAIKVPDNFYNKKIIIPVSHDNNEFFKIFYFRKSICSRTYYLFEKNNIWFFHPKNSNIKFQFTITSYNDLAHKLHNLGISEGKYKVNFKINKFNKKLNYKKVYSLDELALWCYSIYQNLNNVKIK